MYNNIVIPVAFGGDRDVDGAMKVAQRLASDGASITFLHVLEVIPVYAADYVPAQAVAQGRDAVRTALREQAAKLPGAKMAIVDGPAGRSITDWADENHADCIVIASHQPVMSDILLGSTASWVVRHANCAVHVLR